MQDKTETDSILKGVGSYKIIGKPVLAMAANKADKADDGQ